MKKFCSLALVLCMLLTLVVIPTAAEPATEHITFADTDTTYTDSEGNEYTILRTKEDFLKMTNGNYILAGDINLDISYSGTNASVFGAGIYSWYEGILDGNGYAIYGYTCTGGNNAGLFFWASGSTNYKTSNVVIKNASFGTEENPVQLTSSGNGGSGAIAGKIGKNSTVQVINCDAYVEYQGAHANKGGFFGYVLHDNVSISFENCATYGVINAKNKNGGFIGSIPDVKGNTLSFKNCVNNVTMNCQNQGAAGFVGQLNNATIVVTLENCVNNGNITGTVSDVGGLVGYCLTPSLTLINCKNNGTVQTTDDSTCGTLIGRTNTSTPVSIVVPVSEAGTLEGAVGSNNGKVDAAVTLMANGNGTASAGWQKTVADENGKVKVRLLVAVAEKYLEEVETMTFTGTFGLTAGGSKTLTLSLGSDKPIKYYSSVVAAGETLAAAEGYVLIPVVVENIPEADWDGTVSMKLTATGSDNVLAYYQYN